MFPRIERAVAAILAKGKVVAPVDVLMEMDILEPKDLEDWRFGRVPYLERVVQKYPMALLGSFSDIPDVIQDVCEAAMVARERDPLRVARG